MPNINSASLTPSTLAIAALSPPEGALANNDQQLASEHRDMAAQAKNPSALRKAHDDLAIDHRMRLPLSQLSEYLFAPDVQGGPAEQAAVLAALNETLKAAYEKSPNFRRLFNHAWAQRLRDPQLRYSLAVGDAGRVPASVLQLPDVFKRGPRARYPSAVGTMRPSNERALLNSVVKALTQLPEQEPGHPRGPNLEYVNIILKEMGNREPAQTALDSQAGAAVGNRPGAHALSQVLLDLGNGSQPKRAGTTLRKNAVAHFKAAMAEHLASMNHRGVLHAPAQIQLAQKERSALKRLPEVFMRLFQGIHGEESPIELLSKLAEQNARQKLFAYRIDKVRSPLEMVDARDGDCQSFSQLFEMLGKAAGIQGLKLLELEGKMPVRLSSTQPEIVGAAPGAQLLMARHTILQLGEGEQRLYFDPVFGQQVDPDYYGVDQARYLRREAASGIENLG